MFALAGLAPIDGWALLAIGAKAAGYALMLLAAGGPLFLAVFASDVNERAARFVRRTTALCAVALLAVLVLRFAIRAARISGMGVEGMVDTTMLGFVWDSPLGSAAVWRLVGAALVLFVLLPKRLGLAAAVVGSTAIAASYAQVGHSLGEPRWVLACLLIAHLLAASFWVAALAPLRRAAGSVGGPALLHRFGTIATGVVALLFAAGIGFAWLVSGSLAALFGTAYGWTLLLKVLFVSLLLGLAALNKLRLVPALASGDPDAAAALRSSIAWEGAAVVLVLLATATLTSVTTPPTNL